MASQGPLGTGSSTGDNTVGTIAWTNPQFAEVADGQYAVANLGSSQVSYYLFCQQFGFTIPTGATVVGIQVDVLVAEGSGAADITDSTVKLYIVGTGFTGLNRATGATLPSIAQYVTYGGPSDLWGLTPAPSDINQSLFGVGYSTVNAGAFASSANVDFVRMTVYYTLGTNQVRPQVRVFRPPQASYDYILRPDG